MKKFTILLVILACASFAFAQTVSTQHSNFNYAEKKATMDAVGVENYSFRSSDQSKDATTYLDVDFETTMWEIGNNVSGSTINWVVTDAETVLNYQSIQQYFSSFPSDERILEYLKEEWFKWEKAAFIDVLGGFNPSYGGRAQTTEAYIEFTVNLEDSRVPKVMFNQFFLKLNAVKIYLDYSVDGTNFTSIELMEGADSNLDYFDDIEVLLPNAGGSSNVKIRLRLSITDISNIRGYYWLVDNLRVIEASDYDLWTKDGRVSFFEYFDYHDPSNVGSGTNDDGEVFYFNRAWHYSGHLGRVPLRQITDNGDPLRLAFHSIVQNMGRETITPGLKVELYEGEIAGEPMWTKTQYSTKTIAPNAVDTLDVWDTNEYILLPNIAKKGKYTVKYETVIDGQVDEFTDNNFATAYFEVTDSIYGRDVAKYTNPIGPGSLIGGNKDGARMAIMYYIYSDDKIAGVDFYVPSGEMSEAGTSIDFQIQKYDNGWVPQISKIFDIEADNIGAWNYAEFGRPVDVKKGDAIIIVLEFTFGGKTVVIGNDATHKVHYQNVMWDYDGTGSFTNYVNERDISPMTRLVLTKGTSSVGSIKEMDVNIFPNPTDGALHIENVRGATIEVLNVMGQLIERVDNADELNIIDMSGYSNGNYFVKIIKNNQVAVEKINLVK